MFAGFDFVAAKILFGFGLGGNYPLEWTKLFEFNFIRGVHSIFGRVVMALPASLANQTNDLSFVAFSHKY